MSESVIADFVGSFVAEEHGHAEPVQGRIILSQKRLVAVDDEGTLTIPLSAVFDLVVGSVPQELRGFFRDSITVAYRRGETRYVLVVESETDTIDRFTSVMFKVHLNGLEATVRHPVRVGGRETDAPARTARLRLDAGSVSFAADEDRFAIDIATVSDFQKTRRALDGEQRDLIAVRHMPAENALLTFVSLPTTRLMNLLGRYLRIEYDEMMQELEEIELTEEQIEVLLGIYSAGESAALGSLLEMDPSHLTMVLNTLESEGLVVAAADATRLTPTGRTVVNSRLEEVNF